VLIFFALSAWLATAQVLPTSAQAPKAPPAGQEQAPATPPSAQDQPIPLAQVAERAEELDRLLDDISKQLASTAELLESYRDLQTQAEKLNERIPEIQRFLAAAPNAMELRDEEQYLRLLNERYAADRKLLTSRAAELEGQVRTLDEQYSRWRATLNQAGDNKGIETVLARITRGLNAIQATRSRAQEQLNKVLTLQNFVSQQDRQISAVLNQLVDAQERARGRLLQRDSPPLWAMHDLQTSQQPMTRLMWGFIDRDVAGAGGFLRAHWFRIVVILTLYVLALTFALKLRRLVPGENLKVPPGTSEVLARPFSLALLSALLGSIGLAASSPTSVAFVIYLASVIMTLRLLPLLIDTKLRHAMYALAAFNALEGVRLVVPFSPVLKRWLFSLLIFAAIVVFVRLTRPLRMHKAGNASPLFRLLAIGAHVGLVLLCFAFVAGVVGFSALASVLGLATLLGTFLAATYYTLARIVALLLTTLLNSALLRDLLEGQVAAIERRSVRILGIALVLWWLRSELYLFTIYDAVIGALSQAMNYPIGYGKVHFTISGVLSVLLIMLFGYGLAKVVTLVLKKLLLSRFKLQRGVPHAISTVTYYVLLLLVALAAIADAGVQLDKFTVITGAVGVGLGFGLQNIVNNFVSGIILLFERPIHIGDTVDVGGLVGTVRRIGARSSTVVTFQGAEVIVPNSNLISNQVINWTLSSPWRRVDIPVGVVYGTDPERVLRLLIDTAESHPGVMLQPRPPEAFFMGFGESAMSFELRFWSERQETWFQLKSDVAVAVLRALQEAGIEIPVPQRDLHLKSIDAAIANGFVVKRRSLVTDKESA
jgi:small-conductance mechanosensitive channel